MYVQQINREINVTEGGNVTEVCNASAGIFPAAVTWIKDGVVVPTVGKWLNIINISRNETGQYKCLANNTCGNNSTLTRINVQCKSIFCNFNLNQVYQLMLLFGLTTMVSVHSVFLPC